MSYSFEHAGASLPITLAIDEDAAERPCPTCARTGADGTVTVRAPLERQSGTTPGMCSRGHMVLVTWTRETTPASPDA